MGMTTSANTNIITHYGLVNAHPLFHQLQTSQATDFMIRINSNNWSGESTRLRLKYSQLQIGLQECILTAHPNVFLSINYTCNFFFNLLKSLKAQCFDFRPSSIHKSWHIPNNGPTILSLLNTPPTQIINSSPVNTNIQKVLKSFHRRKGILISLIHVNQLLLNKGTSLMTWPQLKSCFGISLRGRTPLFYTTLQYRLTSGNTPNINDNLIPLFHSPSVVYPVISLHPPSTDGRKKEWIVTHRQNNVIIGKIIKKTPSLTCTYQH
jgi:hypothetical protein